MVLSLLGASDPLGVGNNSPRPHATGSVILCRHNSGGTAATTTSCAYRRTLPMRTATGYACIGTSSLAGVSGVLTNFRVVPAIDDLVQGKGAGDIS